LIRIEGGTIVEDVTVGLDYLIVGRTRSGQPSAAEKQADRLNQTKGAAIRVVSAQDFYALALPTRDEALALLRGDRSALERWALRRKYPLPLDLSGADLRGVKLGSAQLTAVDLRGADLREAHLVYSDLAQLEEVRADGLKFEHAQLQKVRDSSLRNADLGGAFFSYLGTTGVIERTDFTGAQLVGTFFQGASLASVVFRNANLQRANFAGA